MHSSKRILANVLQGLPPDWPPDADLDFVARVARIAVSERVHVLVLAALPEPPAADRWTARLRELLLPSAREEAALDLVRTRDLKIALERLREAGIRALLLKGGALAVTHYDESHHRPRCDTDLLVRPDDARRAEAVLQGEGYRRLPAVRGRLIAYESTWSRQAPLGATVRIDLHWRVSNTQGFARSFGFDELWTSSRKLPTLAASARAPDDVHMLFVVAMHLIGGDRWGEGHRLIHLQDLELLANGLDGAAWDRLVEVAEARSLRGVVGEALRRAARFLGSSVPGAVLERLDAQNAGSEITAGYIGASPRRALWVDLRSLPRWRDRAQLLLEHAFPDVEYMRRRYGLRAGAPVAPLYARRLLGDRLRDRGR